MPEHKGPNRSSLHTPYAPLNEFIQLEQAAGKLKFDGIEDPWPDTKTAHEAVLILARHRAGYALFPKDLQSFVQEVCRSKKKVRPLSFDNHKMARAIAVWAGMPDRRAPEVARPFSDISLLYIPFDAPYEPINQFIMAEQAAGKLQLLPPWDEKQTLRTAIKALRRARLGAQEIFKRCGDKAVFDSLGATADSKIARNIRISHIEMGMSAWAEAEDRKSLTSYSNGKGRMVPDDEIVPAFNEIVQWLDEQGLIPSDNPEIWKEDASGRNRILAAALQQPFDRLTAREALVILYASVGSTGHMAKMMRETTGAPPWGDVTTDDIEAQITQGRHSRTIDTETAAEIAGKYNPSIARILNRICNVIASRANSIREEDIPVVAQAYWHYAKCMLGSEPVDQLRPSMQRQISRHTNRDELGYALGNDISHSDYGAVLLGLGNLSSRERAVLEGVYDDQLSFGGIAATAVAGKYPASISRAHDNALYKLLI